MSLKIASISSMFFQPPLLGSSSTVCLITPWPPLPPSWLRDGGGPSPGGDWGQNRLSWPWQGLASVCGLTCGYSWAQNQSRNLNKNWNRNWKGSQSIPCKAKGAEEAAGPHRGTRCETHGRRRGQLCLSHWGLCGEDRWGRGRASWGAPRPLLGTVPLKSCAAQGRPAPTTLESPWSRQKHHCPGRGSRGGWSAALAREQGGLQASRAGWTPRHTQSLTRLNFLQLPEGPARSTHPGAVSHAASLPLHPLWVFT